MDRPVAPRRLLSANPRGQALSPNQARAFETLSGAKTKLTSRYYSKARFAGTIAANAVTIASGTEARAFVYPRGQSMNGAGYPATTVATFSDTNLQKPGTTLHAQSVFIHGLAIQALSISDGALLRKLAPEMSVKLAIGGADDSGVYFGPLESIPGGAGLFGAADAPSQGASGIASFGSLGNPYDDNVLAFEFPILWDREGQPDSNLNVILRVEREVTLNCDDGVTGDVEIQVLVKLLVSTEASRSRNF